MERINLPWDLIENILSRVPAKSLAQLRSTSKQWHALLKSASFVRMHSANAPKESMIIMLMDSKVYLTKANLHGIHNNIAPSFKVESQFYLSEPEFKYIQVRIHDIFHCNGLLLCTTNFNRLVVCNPCLGETKWIKPSHKYKDTDCYAIGYDNKSSYKNYKVLRMDRQDHVSGMFNNYEIYDFITDSWRVFNATTKWLLPNSSWLLPNSSCSSGVSVKGNTYWVASDSRPQYHKLLLSFDFSTKRFQSLCLPRSSFLNKNEALSVVREELLYLLSHYNADTNSTDLHVWVTTSTPGSVLSWNKFLTVQDICRNCVPKGLISFLADDQNKVLVCCCKYFVPNERLFVFGDNSHIQHVYDHHGGDSTHGSSCSVLMNYVPSLTRISYF